MSTGRKRANEREIRASYRKGEPARCTQIKIIYYIRNIFIRIDPKLQQSVFFVIIVVTSFGFLCQPWTTCFETSSSFQEGSPYAEGMNIFLYRMETLSRISKNYYTHTMNYTYVRLNMHQSGPIIQNFRVLIPRIGLIIGIEIRKKYCIHISAVLLISGP